VSHSKERAEKICLNCGAALSGRFCHVCGQENIEPKKSVPELVTHFFNDITHFDGKFFVTVRYLISKPGFLPKEFNNGRRAGYLDPVRMYVFTSALFFLIFYSVFNESGFVSRDANNESKPVATGDTVRNAGDTYRELLKLADSGKLEDTNVVLKNGTVLDVITDWRQEKSIMAYDSAQAALPEHERDNWLSRGVSHRLLRYKARYGEYSNEEIRKQLTEKFIHSLPALLFISLPLYALYLKLLYIRNKKIYYVDHVMFLIYLYIFTFLIFLILFTFDALKKYLWNSGWVGLAELTLVIYGVIYTLQAMHRFYGQSRKKTVLKFVLLNILTSISLLVLGILFFGFAVYRL
jgi:Protein of unknown function (DUF3667)